MDADTGRIVEVLRSCGIQVKVGVVTPTIVGIPTDPIIVQMLAALAAAGIVLVEDYIASIVEAASASAVTDATNP